MSTAAEGRIKQPLPWQASLWSDWLRQLSAKRLPHALLISGMAGLGKGRLAQAFAQSVLCLGPLEQKPCASCKSCQLMTADSHPDLRVIAPAAAGKAIKIDQIRDLVDFLSGTSQQGGWKCVIIEPAEAMNSHAANALLKSLEEPPPETLMILVSSMPSRLMATLRSRCRQVPVVAPSRAEALRWLEPRVGGRAAELLDYAHGAPCAALTASEKDRLADRAQVLEVLLKLALAQTSTAEAVKLLQAQAGVEALDQILSFLNRLAKIQLSGAESVDSLGEAWSVLVEGIDSCLLFRYTDKLTQAKSLLLSSANPNPQLLWEELMFDWQALVAGPRSVARRVRL